MAGRATPPGCVLARGIIQPGCATVNGAEMGFRGEEEFLLVSWVGASITSPKKYVGPFV